MSGSRGMVCRAERFSKSEMRQGKTPDFRVFKGADFVLYCESKHVQYDDWLDKQLANALLGSDPADHRRVG